MAFQSDQDWQLTKKTVLERNSHMFNNPLMSDIKLTCGESKRKCFYTHKYVLATSSPVFYVMFYGDLAEKNPTVHLEDADGESLGEFLRFLYTDECTLTPEIALEVLYLAKKYIIPSLTEVCVKVLLDNMKPANVFTLHEQAIHFDEKELEEKCWKMIGDQASEAVTSDAFIDINHKTLINLLKRVAMNIKEIELFQAVLKWSESECLKKGIEVTGINKRTVLGDGIYQIRFLSMSEKDFTQHVALQSGLLTTEEIVTIYESFNGFDVPGLRWKLLPRRRWEKLRCRRFVSFHYYSLGYLDCADCISFRVNKPCTFHGVCLFGDRDFSKYEVTLDVGKAKVSGTFTSELKNESEGVYGFDVMLSTPILVDENELVNMVATVDGPRSLSGEDGKESIEVGGAVVTFSRSSVPSYFTGVELGQFYEIILSI